MNLLTATLTSYCFSVDDSLYEIKPLAVLRPMRQAIHASRPQRADCIAHTQTIAVDELLDGRLVRTIVARRPRRMIFVERSIVENLLMDGTGRNENKAVNTSLACRFDELKRAHNISLDELDKITFRT